MRVLILSVGSLCAHNILCLLQSRRSEYVIIGANSVAESAGVFLCDAAHLVPAAADTDSYAGAVLRLIETERPDLVVPTREEDVVALARIKASYGGPAVLLVGSVEAAEILEDKRLTASFAERHGLPFAPTEDTHEGALRLADNYGYPLIAKPARGNGTRGVALLLERSHLDAAFESEAMLVQPFLDGPADMSDYKQMLRRGLPFCFSYPEPNQYAYQVVIGAEGALSEGYASRNTMVMGKPERSLRIFDEQLLAAGRAFAEAIRAEGWVGPFNAQFKKTPAGAFVGFEVNGRFTGSSAARGLSGFDEWAAVLRGFGFEAPETENPAVDVRIAHGVLTHYAVPASALRELETEGVWRRSS